ncbi:4-hydroxythreonine-4-phosphate dehydrogenase PdxA [Rubrimonas cliftonensis]|uniref:4-hydroxythreonine-4-phosphate dehydrogenase n=1 Tax=Rubrimonas cliftonensis TaxID=89524 RepID=A0A1H3W026_9RHOB|nr:4-hydroxythreonine-4-phosphate dehydrogenase PdxA [Rubrimonas cliftonensis]SDZ80409.1 4-hydroxythreonine-4-phosphate dehydrogenase [Rubrimonas cliftonensis]
MTRPLALTMGDPAGVGGEIAVAAWAELSRDAGARPFFAIDDPRRLAAIAATRGLRVREIGSPDEAAALFREALPVLAEPLAAPAPPGRPDAANAPAVVRSIARAARLAMDGVAAGVVTNPINKKALMDGAGFAFPGHTEYLAHLDGAARAVMMLAAPALKVIPVTIHLSLADAIAALDAASIRETIRIAHAALRRDFGIAMPRFAVSGLNPHAGEGGAMGREEITLIGPALDALRAEGLDIAGPLPADTMFHPAARARYDVAVCMYHDQALIPIKTLDFAHGVNVTLGLSFIRTSPDHGTAYDIAGKGTADAASLIEALRLADAMAKARASGGPGF